MGAPVEGRVMDLDERRRAYDRMIGLLEAEMAAAPSPTYAGVIYSYVGLMKKYRDWEPVSDVKAHGE